MTDFTARRPVIKSLVKVLLSVVCGIALPMLFFAVYDADPQGVVAKMLQSVYFSVFTVGALFAVSFFADGIRDLVSPPTVSVRGDTLKIFGFPPVALSDVERVEMVNISKREGKSIPAVAVYVKNNEEPRLIKRDFTGIPLDTVKYAIEIRLNK